VPKIFFSVLHPFRRVAGTRCVGPERIVGTQGALR
jgi:hypothetical protein